jgi:hypothetical protein
MTIMTETKEDVCSNTYRGHRITTMRDQSGWVVILDRHVQKEVVFEAAEEAEAWLRRRIDERIAEAIFPGLARSYHLADASLGFASGGAARSAKVTKLLSTDAAFAQTSTSDPLKPDADGPAPTAAPAAG